MDNNSFNPNSSIPNSFKDGKINLANDTATVLGGSVNNNTFRGGGGRTDSTGYCVHYTSLAAKSQKLNFVSNFNLSHNFS